MGKRDELIAKYADDLRNKCKMEPDMALLTKVTIGCGPAIYDNDAQTVAASQASELETIKKNFLMKKSKKNIIFFSTAKAPNSVRFASCQVRTRIPANSDIPASSSWTPCIANGSSVRS